MIWEAKGVFPFHSAPLEFISYPTAVVSVNSRPCAYTYHVFPLDCSGSWCQSKEGLHLFFLFIVDVWNCTLCFKLKWHAYVNSSDTTIHDLPNPVGLYITESYEISHDSPNALPILMVMKLIRTPFLSKPVQCALSTIIACNVFSSRAPASLKASFVSCSPTLFAFWIYASIPSSYGSNAGALLVHV